MRCLDCNTAIDKLLNIKFNIITLINYYKAIFVIVCMSQ